MFVFTLLCEIHDILYMKCFMESSLYTILHWKSLNLEGDGLQLPKIGGSEIKLRGGQPWKTGAVVRRWVATLKKSVPPPPRIYRYWAAPPIPQPTQSVRTGPAGLSTSSTTCAHCTFFLLRIQNSSPVIFHVDWWENVKLRLPEIPHMTLINGAMLSS